MIKEVDLHNPVELAQLRRLHRDSQIYQHIELDGKTDDDEFRATVRKSLEHNLSAENQLFLMGVAGDPFGYIQLFLPDEHSEAWIDDLYVDPTFRHQGRSQQLLTKAESILASRGAKVLRLYTQIHNAGARATYDKAGFAVTSIEDGYVNYEKKIA